MLTITNIKWLHRDFIQLGALTKVIANRLSQMNILTAMSISDNCIVFKALSGQGKRIAFSKVKNVIKLKEGDARIVRKGRDFLETERITKDQETYFFSVIQTVLDELNLHATVTLGDLVLRDGKVKTASPVLKSYPVTKG